MPSCKSQARLRGFTDGLPCRVLWWVTYCAMLITVFVWNIFQRFISARTILSSSTSSMRVFAALVSVLMPIIEIFITVCIIQRSWTLIIIARIITVSIVIMLVVRVVIAIVVIHWAGAICRGSWRARRRHATWTPITTLWTRALTWLLLISTVAKLMTPFTAFFNNIRDRSFLIRWCCFSIWILK